MTQQDIDIEDLLVWAYRDQLVDRRIGRGVVEPWERLMSVGSSWRLVADYAALGTLVDTSRKAFTLSLAGAADGVSPDARAVMDAVLRLEAEACVLVVIHARAGTRPGVWAQGEPRLVPSIRSNGKPETIQHNNRPVACVIRWSHDPATWEWQKQQYRTWRAALDVLADELPGHLVDFRAFRPRAPWSPWAGEQDRRGHAA